MSATLLRSLETMRLRTDARLRQRAGGGGLSSRDHPKVRLDLVLGHSSRAAAPSALLARQCSGAGSTFSFAVRGGEAEASACSTGCA